MTGSGSGGDREGEIRREIENHLDLEAESLMTDDQRADDARRRARLAFGNPAVIEEDARAAWARVWLEQLAYDIRYALRIWAASPALSLVAIVTIALGIGGSTAVVGQIRAVFWTPLAVSNPVQLRQIAWASPRYPYVLGGALNVLPGPRVAGAFTFGSFSYPAYEALRNESTAFSGLACWADFGEARPVTLGALGFGNVQFVSGNYFDTLGVGAAIGRTIRPEDDGPETWAPVAMIGHQFWRRVFGSDPAVTSRVIDLNGRSFAIVGVLPESFSGLDPATAADVMVPTGAAAIAAQTVNPVRNRGIWSLCRVVGRMRADVTDGQAAAEVERILAAWIATAPPPDPYDPPRVHMIDGAYGVGTLRDAMRAPLAVLLVAVGTLLLAACANIAGLLLARGDVRQREIATRLALGAPRLRLVRQLVTESLVLSLTGGILGVMLAFGLAGRTRDLLGRFMPSVFGADRSLNVSTAPDGTVLAAALLMTIGAGLLFGLSPAFRTTKVDLIGTIRQPQDGGSGRGGWRFGRFLVAAQAALAVVLLVTCGLFVQTLANLRTEDAGFRVDHLLYARVEPRSGNLPQTQRAQFFEQAIARLAQLPGVVAASAGTQVPFGGDTNVGAAPTLSVCLPAGAAGRNKSVPVHVSFVAPDYFRTLGVEVLAGRDFTWSDRAGGPQAPTIVSEELARQTFGAADTVGRSITLTTECERAETVRSQLPVVGLVSDVRTDSRASAAATLYLPLGGAGVPVTLLTRTSGEPSAMISAVRKAVTEINRDIPTFSEAPLSLLRERAFRRERLISILLGLFATLTALVGALGVYGMLSYDVVRRTREIGIRMAIGADRKAVMRLVIGDSMTALLGGIVVGLVTAFVANWVMGSMFYGVTAGDPGVLVSAAAAFVLVAAIAAALPARSATRVDPVLSLRL